MYIFLVLSNLIVSFVTQNKKIILSYFLLSYILIIGLRYDVGIDYMGYRNSFLKNINYEIGYSLLSNFVHFFKGNFYCFTVLISFFTVLPISYYLINNFRKLAELRMGIFLFLLSSFNFSAMNLMRQSLATSFCFLATDFYYKKNYKTFIFLILIAFSFHKSVIIYLILFFLINNIRVKNNFSIIFLFLLFFSSKIISYSDLLLKVNNLTKVIYSSYNVNVIEKFSVSTQQSNNIFNLGLLSLIILYTLIVFKEKEYLEYYEKFMFFSLIFRIFSTQNFLFNRISLYFDLYIFLSVLMYYLKNKDFKKKVILGTTIFILFVNFIKTGYFSPETQKNKYKSIFYEKVLK